MTTRRELFLESYMRRGAERKAKKYISKFCQDMPPEDFRYAAENNIYIIKDFLRRLLLQNAGEEKAARKKAQSYRHLIEKLATIETLTRLFSEVSPEHGKVLLQHPSWVERQLRSSMAELFPP